MKSFTAKDPRESIIVSFDFTKLLSVNESIVSASTTSKPSVGTDPNSDNMITGPTLATGAICSQRIQGGVSSVTYVLSAIANTSLNNVIVLSGQMLVVSGGA